MAGPVTVGIGGMTVCMSATFSSICDFTLLSVDGKLLKKTKPTTVFVQASANPTHPMTLTKRCIRTST